MWLQLCAQNEAKNKLHSLFVKFTQNKQIASLLCSITIIVSCAWETEGSYRWDGCTPEKEREKY